MADPGGAPRWRPTFRRQKLFRPSAGNGTEKFTRVPIGNSIRRKRGWVGCGVYNYPGAKRLRRDST